MSRELVEVENLEIELLLIAIHRHHGLDLREYSQASLKRRLDAVREREGLQFFSELLPRVIHDRGFYRRLVDGVSVTVTEMFRDPGFFVSVRENVIDTLRTWPFIKVWHAGCATGEEVYSFAILLKEEGLLERAQIYATDFNEASLEKARAAIYSPDDMKLFTANYLQAGGKGDFSSYYRARYGSARFSDELTDKITFSRHNLVSDGSFGEMNLIVCRNVFIYFGRALQNQVLTLFGESLCPGGFLCLGNRETVDFSKSKHCFETLDRAERIYRFKGLGMDAEYPVGNG